MALLDGLMSDVVLSRSTMKDTTVSFKLERGLKTKLVALAMAENRTLSNFIEKILKEEIAKRRVEARADQAVAKNRI